jgi:hypothetical protein
MKVFTKKSAKSGEYNLILSSHLGLRIKKVSVFPCVMLVPVHLNFHFMALKTLPEKYQSHSSNILHLPTLLFLHPSPVTPCSSVPCSPTPHLHSSQNVPDQISHTHTHTHKTTGQISMLETTCKSFRFQTTDTLQKQNILI